MIVRELDVTGSQLQWIVDSYVIVFVCLVDGRRAG